MQKEEIDDQLQKLKKELARKQKKLQKCIRREKAKAHVRQKIQEQEDLVRVEIDSCVTHDKPQTEAFNNTKVHFEEEVLCKITNNNRSPIFSVFDEGDNGSEPNQHHECKSNGLLQKRKDFKENHEQVLFECKFKSTVQRADSKLDNREDIKGNNIQCHSILSRDSETQNLEYSGPGTKETDTKHGEPIDTDSDSMIFESNLNTTVSLNDSTGNSEQDKLTGTVSFSEKTCGRQVGDKVCKKEDQNVRIDHHEGDGIRSKTTVSQGNAQISPILKNTPSSNKSCCSDTEVILGRKLCHAKKKKSRKRIRYSLSKDKAISVCNDSITAKDNLVCISPIKPVLEKLEHCTVKLRIGDSEYMSDDVIGLAERVGQQDLGFIQCSEKVEDVDTCISSVSEIGPFSKNDSENLNGRHSSDKGQLLAYVGKREDINKMAVKGTSQFISELNTNTPSHKLFSNFCDNEEKQVKSKHVPSMIDNSCLQNKGNDIIKETQQSAFKKKPGRKRKSKTSESSSLDFSFLDDKGHDLYSQVKSRSRRPSRQSVYSSSVSSQSVSSANTQILLSQNSQDKEGDFSDKPLVMPKCTMGLSQTQNLMIKSPTAERYGGLDVAQCRQEKPQKHDLLTFSPSSKDVDEFSDKPLLLPKCTMEASERLSSVYHDGFPDRSLAISKCKMETIENEPYNNTPHKTGIVEPQSSSDKGNKKRRQIARRRTIGDCRHVEGKNKPMLEDPSQGLLNKTYTFDTEQKRVDVVDGSKMKEIEVSMSYEQRKKIYSQVKDYDKGFNVSNISPNRELQDNITSCSTVVGNSDKTSYSMNSDIDSQSESVILKCNKANDPLLSSGTEGSVFSDMDKNSSGKHRKMKRLRKSSITFPIPPEEASIESEFSLPLKDYGLMVQKKVEVTSSEDPELSQSLLMPYKEPQSSSDQVSKNRRQITRRRRTIGDCRHADGKEKTMSEDSSQGLLNKTYAFDSEIKETQGTEDNNLQNNNEKSLAEFDKYFDSQSGFEGLSKKKVIEDENCKKVDEVGKPKRKVGRKKKTKKSCITSAIMDNNSLSAESLSQITQKTNTQHAQFSEGKLCSISEPKNIDHVKESPCQKQNAVNDGTRNEELNNGLFLAFGEFQVCKNDIIMGSLEENNNKGPVDVKQDREEKSKDATQSHEVCSEDSRRSTENQLLPGEMDRHSKCDEKLSQRKKELLKLTECVHCIDMVIPTSSTDSLSTLREVLVLALDSMVQIYALGEDSKAELLHTLTYTEKTEPQYVKCIPSDTGLLVLVVSYTEDTTYLHVHSFMDFTEWTGISHCITQWPGHLTIGHDVFLEDLPGHSILLAEPETSVNKTSLTKYTLQQPANSSSPSLDESDYGLSVTSKLLTEADSLLCAVKKVNNLPDAVIGLSSEILYLWNSSTCQLLLKMDFSLNSTRCTSVSYEQGFIFLLVWTVDCWRVSVINPSTQKYTSVVQVNFSGDERIIDSCTDGNRLLATTSCDELLCWDMNTRQVMFKCPFEKSKDLCKLDHKHSRTKLIVSNLCKSLIIGDMNIVSLYKL